MSDNVSVQQAKAVVKTDKYLQRGLWDACRKGDLSKVKDLITRGVDPHNGDKETALKEACRYGIHVHCYLITILHVEYLEHLYTVYYAHFYVQ